MKLTATALYVAAVLAVTCIPAGIARGDDIETLIREIIEDARTNAERSAALMEAVSLAAENRQLKVVLLAKAIEYGAKSLRTPDDYNRMQEALGALVTEDPDRKAHWLSRKAHILRRQCVITKSVSEKQKLARELLDTLTAAGNSYAAKGDWKAAAASLAGARSAALAYKLPDSDRLSNYMRAVSYLAQTQEKTNKYVETLKTSPGDIKTRTSLVTALLTAMDDPAGAGKHLNADLDERLQMFVPLAAKDVAEVPVAECRSLADWYCKELSKSAVPIVKFRMLSRAKAYYGQVIERHGKADLTTTTAKVAMARIESEIAKLGHVDPMICSYCGGTGRMPCATCLVNGKSSGLTACSYCKGTGKGKCSTCGGSWGSRCSRCSGRGKVSGAERRGGVFYKTYSTCSTCKGTGMTYSLKKRRGVSKGSGVCPTCGKRQSISARGTRACTHCGGKGGISACSTCRGSKTVFCTHCRTGRSAEAAYRNSTTRPDRDGLTPASTRPAKESE